MLDTLAFARHLCAMQTTTLKDWHDGRGARWQDGEIVSYGSSELEWRAISEDVGLHDASTRDRVLVTGDDRASFVQGLCTNDVVKPEPGTVFETAFITPKGKLVADARVVKLDDALLLEMEAGRGDALIELLTRYRIHEDCEFVDASEQLAQLELWGDAAKALGEPVADGESKAVAIGDGTYLVAGTAFGAIVFAPVDSAKDAAEALVSAGARLVGRDAVEPRRLEIGLGRYGIDWSESTNPLVAGLDRMLDYTKGCYVGQEVVAKATYIGHVNRRLVRLTWEGEPAPADTPLLGGRAPGRVTSSALVPGTNKVFALGIVRRDVAAEGQTLRLGDEEGVEVTVSGWPWLSKEKPR